MKKVSIIIPTYNSPSKTIRNIKSINPLRFEADIEIIVVDDKSTKDISNLEKEISHYRNVELLYNRTNNKGAGVVRNIGLEIATGEWIIFADADDYFLPSFEKVLNSMITSEIKADLVYFKCSSVIEETNKPANRNKFTNSLLDSYMFNSSEANELSLRTRWVTPWGKVFRHKLLLDHNISFEKIMVSNDILFSTKAGVLANNITFIDQTAYCVTQSNSSLTTGRSKQEFYIRTNALSRSIKFIKKNLTNREFKLTGYSSKKWIITAIKKYDISVLDVLKAYMILRRSGLPFI